MHISGPRWSRTLSAAFLLLALGAACTELGSTGTGTTSKTAGGDSAAAGQGLSPSPGESGQKELEGGVGDPGATGTPATAPTQSGAAGPTATPPGETPLPVPSAVFVLSVEVTPATATINVPPAGATPPLYPTTVDLAARVALSNSLATDSVTWSSNATDSAAVDAKGRVSARSRPGQVVITATSVLAMDDGSTKATASCLVTVTSDGAAGVKIQ